MNCITCIVNKNNSTDSLSLVNGTSNKLYTFYLSLLYLWRNEILYPCVRVRNEWMVKKLNELIACKSACQTTICSDRCDSFAGGRPIRDQRLNRTNRARESPWSTSESWKTMVSCIRGNLAFRSFFERWTIGFERSYIWPIGYSHGIDE